MRLYIIRHADPDYANDTITDIGHREAQALAERLQPVRIDHIYSSPMGRAQATAAYTAKTHDKPVTVLPWTAELGHWRIDQDKGDVCVWDVHGHRVRACAPLPGHEDWHASAPFDQPVFREEYDALCAESDGLLARHGYVRESGVYRVVQPNREAIAVFCHGGFGLTWLAHLLAVPLPLMWAGFFLPPTSLTTIVFDERSPELAVPRCVGLGDVAHLYAAGLTEGRVPSGIKANFD